MKEFVHLRVYSNYSLYKSIINIKDLINITKKNNMKGLCLTDDRNLFNSVKFYKECLKNKIKPLIGCNFELKINSKKINIILLIKNYKGYLNLSKIISKINIFNEKYLNFKLIKGSLKKHLFLILNLNSFYLKKKYNFKDLNNISIKLKKIFKNNIYLEIQKNKNDNYNKILNISKFNKIPLLAINPISFLKKRDFLSYKAKIFIYKKSYNKINFCKKHYFYKKKKFIKLFENIKFSLKNTFKLLKKCNLFINFNKFKLPYFRLKKKINTNNYFIKKILKKFKLNNFCKKKKYKERLIYELKIINQMKLADYFLIVYDFIKWSRKNNIQIGPGRGSSAGSLISFLLNITILDPIKYNLIFERFLNIERNSIPDFDVDFSQKDREKVVKYIKKKYGISFISQIITFNKINFKNSIRDIGKFLKFNYDFINEINNLISINYNISILDLLKKDKNFYEKYKKNKKIRKLIDLSATLEGVFKNIGIHAGGIVITPNKTFNYFPIILKKKKIISTYYKDDLEDLGILKFDFLGLITLSIIKKSIKNLKFKLNLRNINLYDKLCYENFKKANTISVFQLESQGIRNVLKFSRPKKFENIIAIISLHRPGPIKLIKEFCLKKLKKKKITYIDKRLKNILKETYGVIVYQEQIMQIVKIIGGYTLSEADNLRKIISKKKINEIENEKTLFLNRSLKNGLTYKKGLKIFNLIEKFVNYGFNKSHAAAYSLLSYWTMWLKTYYIDYFMSSNMSYYFNDLKKIKLIIEDSINNKIYILPININYSGKNFLTLKKFLNKKIRYGFKGVIGLGINIINHIIKIRKIKKFKSFLDFYKRIDKTLVNYKSIESLIASGAFDSLNYNRANLIKKLEFLSKINLKNDSNFNLIKNLHFKNNFFWSFKEKIIEEKNIIGFFFLNNIYNIYKKKINSKIYKNFNKGIIIKITDKTSSNNFILKIIGEDKKEKNIIINEKLFIKKINYIKKYNFIFFNGKKIKNNFFIIKNILNF